MFNSIQIITITFLFFSCQSSTNHKQSKNHTKFELAENSLPVDSLISIPYKVFSERLAFGFDDQKKNKKYLAESDGYDENRNLIEHIRYNTDGKMEEHVLYVYENGLLKDEYRLNNGNRGELYKTNYSYNGSRKLNFSTISTFERRTKKDTTNPWKHVFFESDFEKKKSWGDMKVTEFSYDSNGNLFREYTAYEYSQVVEEIYKYNEVGKVIEETTINSGNISRKITTNYYQDSIESICIFSSDGTGNICKQKFDKNNNLLIELCTETGTKKQMYIRKYFYNTQNKVIKEEYVTNLSNSIFTLYEYKDNDKPILKVFTVTND